MIPPFVSKEEALSLGIRRTTFVALGVSLGVNLILSGAILVHGFEKETYLLPLTQNVPLALSPAKDEYLGLIARDILFFATFLTPQNIDFNRRILLTHVSPELYGDVEKEMLLLARMVKDKHASQSFEITEMVIDAPTLCVSFIGFRKLFIDSKMTESVKTGYELKFKQIAGRMVLTHFSEKPNSAKKSSL